MKERGKRSMTLTQQMVDALLKGSGTWNGELQNFASQTYIEEYVFEGLTLPKEHSFRGYNFEKPVRFENCTFHSVDIIFGNVPWVFKDCKFSGRLDFAHSCKYVVLEDCLLIGVALSVSGPMVLDIKGRWIELALLHLTRLKSGRVSLRGCTIKQLSYGQEMCSASIQYRDCVIEQSIQNNFRHVTFVRPVELVNCRVQEPRLFESCTFKDATDFTGTVFRVAPSFHQVTFHQSTRFNDVEKFDVQFPDVTSRGGAEHCYRTLKLEMTRQQATAEALAFGRLELRARQAADKGWKWAIYATYGATSDYGLSIGRQLIWLLLITGISPIWIWAMAKGPTRFFDSDWWNISLSNALPYLGSTKATLQTSLHYLIREDMYFAFTLASVLQSLASSILLFLVGLGIRNRLRLK